MVLLPKPPPPKEPSTEIARNIFFENDTMDYMAKQFIGNNFRLVLNTLINNRNWKDSNITSEEKKQY